jgi:hypothetical protein
MVLRQTGFITNFFTATPDISFINQKKLLDTNSMILIVSLISQLLPKSIHAVTAKGFELKVMLFVLALSVNLWVAT